MQRRKGAWEGGHRSGLQDSKVADSGPILRRAGDGSETRCGRRRQADEAADADGAEASGQGGSAAGGDKEAAVVADKRARQADAPAARADAADADGSEEATRGCQ